METPASISNSATAATLIQRAFRGAQKRIAAEQAELTHVLNALEEADEARINARESVMTQVNKKLEGFIANVGSSLRGGGETALSKSALHAKSLQKKELPSLTVGSLNNFVAGLENNERVAMVDALAILQASTVMFMSEPSVCDITVPEGGKCTIVGDLHGQLVRDAATTRRRALLLFSSFGDDAFFFASVFVPRRRNAKRDEARRLVRDRDRRDRSFARA
jgi:serine/threonine-protein phosphatase with EF-hand domain